MEQDALLVDTDPDSPSKESEKNITRQRTIVETFNAKASAKLHESEGDEHKMKLLLVDFEQGINTSIPAATKKSIAKLNPTNPKYMKYLEMHDAGEVLEIPTKDDAKLLKECRQALRNHLDDKHSTTMSSTFFVTANKLKNEMTEIHTKMEAIYHSVRDTDDVYHDCHHGAKHCRDTYQFEIGMKWQEIHSAMIGLGIEECLSEVAKSKKEQKEEADAEKKRKKRRRSKRNEGRRSNSPNNSPMIASEENNNINSINVDQITNLDGNVVNINDFVKAGNDSNRARTRKERPARQIKSSRGALPQRVGLKLTQHQFNKLLSKKWTAKRAKDGKTFSGNDKRNHGLTLRNGSLFCELCNTPIVIKCGQHLVTEKHQKLYIERREQRNDQCKVAKSARTESIVVATENMMQHKKDKGLRGHSVHEETVLYRVSVLKHALLANMSMGMLKSFAPALDLKGDSSMGLGDVKNLFGDVGRALKDSTKKDLASALEDRYYPFVTIADGSPAGANAEAIIVRFVRKSDHKIMQLLISLRLFEGSLTGEAIAHNLVTELRALRFELGDWIACILDRASSNQKAINVIRSNGLSWVANEPCHSHTIVLPGKELTASCELLRSFRKAYNTGIMFRGKMSDKIKVMFGKKPIISGGVRWYIEWEQVVELDTFGIKNIADGLIPALQEMNVSVQSVKKMKQIACPENIPRLLVEAAAVADVGKLFCQSTYLLEGDDPLAIGSWIVFEKLDCYVNSNSNIIRLSLCTIDKCAEAAKLITCLMDEATAEETEPMRILEFERDELENDRSVTVIELQDALDVANRKQQNDNGNRPGLLRNRRICRAPERFRNDGDDNEDDDEQQMNIEHL